MLFYIAIFVYDFNDVYETIISGFNYRGTVNSIFIIEKKDTNLRFSEHTDDHVSDISDDNTHIVNFWLSDYSNPETLWHSLNNNL